MWSEFGEKKKTACLCTLRNTKHSGAEIWDFFCGGQAAPRAQKRKKRKKVKIKCGKHKNILRTMEFTIR